MRRYNLYEGRFACHSCGSIVPVVRSYPEQRKLTWMCKSKHLSWVDLNTKKSKRDYERAG
jgi:hypothetical protein